MNAKLKSLAVHWQWVAALVVVLICIAAFSSILTRQMVRGGIRWRIRNSIVGYLREELWMRHSPAIRAFLGEPTVPGKGRIQWMLDQKVLDCLATASASSLQRSTLCYAWVLVGRHVGPSYGMPGALVEWVAQHGRSGSVVLYSRGLVHFRYSFPMRSVHQDGLMGPAGHRPRPGVLFIATVPLWCRQMRAWLRSGGRGTAPPVARQSQLAMNRALRTATGQGTLRAILAQGNAVSPAVIPITWGVASGRTAVVPNSPTNGRARQTESGPDGG